MKYRYGKNVLVTGASSGIGLACAELFAKKGFNVCACSRSAPERSDMRSVKMDVCSEESIEAAYDELEKADMLPDIIVHCAGLGIGGAAEDTANEAAHRQMETNYFGVLNVNRRFVPHMREKGKGMVVIVTSVAAFIAIPYQSHYSASKAALESYCECLRMESGKYGIRAACVAPGDTKTAFTSARTMEIPDGSVYKEDCEKSVAKMAKDEQNGKSPESVAKVVLKVAKRRNPPIRTTVGFAYKCIAMLKKLLPKSLVEKLVKMLYT